MTQEKRMWLAIALSLVLVTIWQVIFPPPHPAARRPIASDTRAVVPGAFVATGASPDSQTFIASAPNALPTAGAARVESSAVYVAPVSVALKTPKLDVTFAETGAVMTSLRLSDYFTVKTMTTPSVPVALVTAESVSLPPFALVMDQADRSGLARISWMSKVSGDSQEITFSVHPSLAELPPDIRIEKKFRFNGEYGTDLEITVHNESSREVAVAGGKLNDELYEARREGSFLVHIGPGLGANHPPPAYRDQYLVRGSFGKDGKKQEAVLAKTWWHNIFGLPAPPFQIGWAALENRYFTIALQPKDFLVDAEFVSDANHQMHLWLLLPAFDLQPNSSKSFMIRIFTGPKSTKVLARFNPEFEQLDGMEPTVLPKRVPIARMMISLLSWIHRHVGNWGWSIIILTILVRALLFPLAHYQFKSMGKMQQLKPRIDELQTRYATDKERLQRELMKVYSEAGVNPVGGCLPLIFQMPILVGLFLSLQNSIELRGAPFILWIRDLSVPDTLFHLGSVPINPLPILMCVTMFGQQKLTPMPTADPAQKQMMMMMPVIMTVLFYNFPSGLSLYWVIQNILSMAQQYYIMRSKDPKQPKEPKEATQKND